MTPKKIYIAQVYLDELIDSEDYHEQELVIALSPYDDCINQHSYILESEHNRLVDELRKSAEENENLLRDRKNQHIEVLKAENEKLKADLDYVCGVKGIF